MLKTFIKLTLISLCLTFNTFAKQVEDSVMKVRVRYNQLDTSDVPEYASYEEVLEAFEYIRDARFLSYENIDRKIPWLFVKDFCHTRAQIAVDELENAGFQKPKKVFLHGVLDIRNKYFQLKEGEMIWQHIAPIVNVNGQSYVLDPALSWEKPLSLHDWISTMTVDYEKIMIAVCSGDTYLQTASCNDPQKVSDFQLETDTEWALRFEWNTIKKAGDDPISVLLD